MEYKMELTREEKDILEGKQGETLQKVLKTLVMYGEVFEAKRLVSIDAPAHLVTSFGVSILKPLYEMMDELVENNIKTKEPFTVDPRPTDYENVKANMLQKLVFKFVYGKQNEYEKQLQKVGLKNSNAFTCTCYLDEVGNQPKQGDILSWAESSAVVYANSVLGARSNRNSAIMELFGAIIGKVPEFDLLTDEGRKATWVIEVKTTKIPEAQILGSAIGLKVVEEVPYIKGLDKFLGNTLNDSAKSYFKDMGAASASNGSVGLYHVEGLTPEAVSLGTDLISSNVKTYVIDDAELERVYKSYPVIWKDKEAKPKICFIGCPHLSFSQIYQWYENIKTGLLENNQSKVALRTIFCCAPDVLQRFIKEDKEKYDELKNLGVNFTSICPLMYMNNPTCGKQPVITNSNKLRTYTSSRYYKDEDIIKIIATGRCL
ncbi:aconitase X [Clostridium sp. DL1XJH146]